MSYDSDRASTVIRGHVVKGESRCDECGGSIPNEDTVFVVIDAESEDREMRCRSCFIDND